jgi:hypothetical protein
MISTTTVYQTLIPPLMLTLKAQTHLTGCEHFNVTASTGNIVRVCMNFKCHLQLNAPYAATIRIFAFCYGVFMCFA